MRQKKKESFGETLKRHRVRAGYMSLESAVGALKGHSRGISKPMLNLLERNGVSSIRPEVLQKLAALYKVPYVELATAWFCWRFQLSVDEVVSTHTFIKKVDEHSASLIGASLIEGEEGRTMEIVSRKRLEILEEELPAHSHVCVAAVRFLDDGPYYPMVTRNFLRGIAISYLLPEEGYPIYRAFLARVEAEFPKLRGKLDGNLTHFHSRMNVEASANYVVFRYPDGSVQAYTGLLSGDLVEYFQVADPQLSWRLHQGFQWSVEVSKDSQMRRRLSELSAEFVSGRRAKLS